LKKETKKRTVNLNLLREHLQSTSNVLTIHKLIRKPKELLLLIIDLPLKKKLNNFEIVISLQMSKSITQLTNLLVNLLSKEVELAGSANLPKN
jgi:hypothetical protein